MDHKIRKLMKIHKAFPQWGDMERLYVPRKEGRRDAHI